MNIYLKTQPIVAPFSKLYEHREIFIYAFDRRRKHPPPPPLTHQQITFDLDTLQQIKQHFQKRGQPKAWWYNSAWEQFREIISDSKQLEESNANEYFKFQIWWK